MSEGQRGNSKLLSEVFKLRLCAAFTSVVQTYAAALPARPGESHLQHNPTQIAF